MKHISILTDFQDCQPLRLACWRIILIMMLQAQPHQVLCTTVRRIPVQMGYLPPFLTKITVHPVADAAFSATLYEYVCFVLLRWFLSFRFARSSCPSGSSTLPTCGRILSTLQFLLDPVGQEHQHLRVFFVRVQRIPSVQISPERGPPLWKPMLRSGEKNIQPIMS